MRVSGALLVFVGVLLVTGEFTRLGCGMPDSAERLSVEPGVESADGEQGC